MTENLDNWLSKMNRFIRYDVLKKRAVFTSYRRLCRLHPDREIDYVDFEFKYYQFYHGDQIEKSPVTLSDLPIDVLEKVLENLTIVDRLILRKVSHELRNLVDSTEVYCENLKFSFVSSYSTMELEKRNIFFEKSDDGGCTVFWGKVYGEPNKKYEDDRTFQQAMIADASTFLKNPKLKIGHLEVIFNEEADFTEFFKFLESLNFPLNVRSIYLWASKQSVSSVLDFMNLEKLEEIKFRSVMLTLDQFNEISKMAKMIRLCECCLPKEIGIEQLFQFKEIRSDQFDLTEENLIKIRDNLLNSTCLEYLELEKGGTIDEDEEAEKNELIAKVMSQNPAYDARNRRFSIPNSSDYFQLEFAKSYYWVNLIFAKVSEP